MIRFCMDYQGEEKSGHMTGDDPDVDLSGIRPTISDVSSLRSQKSY